MRCQRCGFQNQEGISFCGQCGLRLGSLVNPTASYVSTTADFVGRQREVGELVSARDDATSGQGRLVMLVGEPGIGKTRTAEEFATYARGQGSLVLWGRCHEQQGMPPYWLWVQVIRFYVRECEPEKLRSDMGAGASIIAEIVPDINELLPGLKPPPELENPEQARFRLFDAITTFLKNVSVQSTALVIILEDLHWADRPSLLLLEFLNQELSDSRLMVIGTYRDIDLSRQHPLSETLGELTRARLFQRVALGGLSLEDEGRLIQATLGAQLNQEFVELIHSRTEGNPLFTGEVIRMLEQEGGIPQQGIGIGIPEGVKQVIGRRLNRLTEECNQALIVASVIGREFEFVQLVRLVEGVSEDGLLDSLEEAQSARVVGDAAQSAGRYQFTHALIQQTLMAELSTTRRVRLHARIIDVFEELYGHDIDTHANELAYHAAESESIIGPDKLIHYSIMAGERDLESYAVEGAFAHFQRALDARENQTMDDQLATIKFGIGRAMASIGRHNQLGWDALRQAFDYYVEQGDVEKAVNLAIHPTPGLGQVTGAADLLVRALELASTDSLQAGYLLARLAPALEYEFADFEGSRKAVMEAITIARRENDEVLEARSLAFLANSLPIDHRPQEAIDVLLRAIEIAQRISDIHIEPQAHFFVARVFLIIGEPDRARIHAEAAFRTAEKLHQRLPQFFGLLIGALCVAYQGDLPKANELAGQSMEIRPPNELMRGFRAWIDLQRDDVEAAKHLVDNLSGNPEFLISWLTRIAYETNNNEYLDMAESAFITWGRSTHALPRFWIRQSAAVAAALRKDTAAAEHYSALAPDKGALIFPALFSVGHVLGLLAQSMGNLNDALTHFEDALTFCRKAGFRPEMAWTLCDYADLLIQRNEPGDLSKARELVEQADEIASNLGMKPLDRRAAALKERLDTRPVPKPHHPHGLTEREMEVLLLMAQGKTTREIANELMISPRTVQRHTTNLYAKINARNRAEATAFVLNELTTSTQNPLSE